MTRTCSLRKDALMAAPVQKNGMRWMGLLALLLLSGLWTGCGQDTAPATPQAPPVTVAPPQVRTVSTYAIFTGSSRASESADVVARVTGTLETVEFAASSPVKAGDLLFTIEAGRYQAARDVAQASVASAKADLLRAETELHRVEKASQSRAVSEMDVDRARAGRDMALAAVASAKARLDDAELDFSYTQVCSPIDGIVSRNLVDAGNLVGQGGATKLTRVNKVTPIYVYFHASESMVLKHLAERREYMDDKENSGRRDGEVQVALANEEGFPHVGVIDFIDNQVDASTGTIELRARLENTDKSLFPGLFVRIKVTGKEIPDAVLVPEVAVGSDLGGKYVLVVGENNIVAQVYVKLGAPQDGGLVHIRSGLTGKETVIVSGLMMARPGRPVTPLTAEQFAAMKQKAMQEKAQK